MSIKRVYAPRILTSSLACAHTALVNIGRPISKPLLSERRATSTLLADGGLDDGHFLGGL